MRRPTPDVAAVLLLAAFCAAAFLPFWLRGLTSFWGDLSYIHRPWRVFDAQCLQAGRVPLWDPYLYFGMPAAAAMQDSLFYAGTAPFFVFSFPTALAFFQLAHYALAGALAFLWLRGEGLRRTSALVGAMLYAVGGLMIANQGFLNHLAVLSLLPAVLLCHRSTGLVALLLSLAFFAGYPPFWLGVLLLFALKSRRSPPRAAGSVLLALVLSAVLLLPAAQLVLHSRRSAGVELAEALRFGYSARDLLGWISPTLVGRTFDPGVDWYRTSYLGFAGFVLFVIGVVRLRDRRWGLVAWISFVLLLTLGETFTPSRLLWAHFPPLRFVRYPGNVAYLALPAFVFAAAAGFGKLKSPLRLLAAVAVCVELLVSAWRGFAPAPRSLWSTRGPAVSALQARLDGHRFLLSPRALEADTGRGVQDWAWRLYGLAAAPYRLSEAAGFGEPLVPRASYELMDLLLSQKSARDAAAYFPWCDILYLLTPAPVPGAPALRHEGDALWSFERFAGSPAPARAYWLPGQEGAALPEAPATPSLPAARALAAASPREDRVEVEADTPAGWVYLSQPRFPGWRAYLETPLGAGLSAAAPALGPFQKLPVPAGPWRLTLLYLPETFRAGVCVTVAALLALLFSGLSVLRRRPA